ncbi:MAG TPA: hypothetical protein VND01_00430 [Candidatus Acidoferrales bacterium]|nr:hypothetical protein [Candidatus Acidoferrales bacterium]
MLKQFLILALVVGSLGFWKIFKNNKPKSDADIVGIGHYVVKENNGIKKEVPQIDPVKQAIDIIAWINKKTAPSILDVGKVGSGKSSLFAELLWLQTDKEECAKFSREPKFAVVCSPKTMEEGVIHDFALPNFSIIDMTKKLPSNIFANHHAFVGSILTALYSDLTARGMMAHTVMTQLYRLLTTYGEIKTWKDFEDTIEKAMKGRGNFDRAVLDAIKGDVQFLKNAGKEGSLDIDWTDLKSNYVLDFGTFGDNEIAKVFFLEYIVRDIFSKCKNKNSILAIDESFRLVNLAQTSHLSTVLREGRTRLILYLATQNYSDVPPKNKQFGTIFAHETQNEEDIEGFADKFLRQFWELIRGHKFIDLTQEHALDNCYVFELDMTRLDKVRKEAWENHLALQNIPNEIKKEEIFEDAKVTEDLHLDAKIIEVLTKSPISLHGYGIGKALGFNSEDAINVRNPLRKLVSTEEIITDYLVYKKIEVLFYSIPGTEQFHNLMLEKTEDEIVEAGWKVDERASRGTEMPDFKISKGGIEWIVEVETGRKESLKLFDDRLGKYSGRVLLVLPTQKMKQRYSVLANVKNGTAKMCLIPEIAKVLSET